MGKVLIDLTRKPYQMFTLTRRDCNEEMEEQEGGKLFLCEEYLKLWEQLDNSMLSEDTNSYLSFVYNNIFLHGIRGAGKTTLMKSLKNELEESSDNKRNYVENITVIGYVDLSMMQHSILEWFFSFLINRVQESQNVKILRELREIGEIMNAILSNNKDTIDFWQIVDTPLFELRQRMFSVVDRLIGKKNETWILLVDDIDLADVTSIISFLQQVYYYMSHPNIVIVGSGNWNVVVNKLRSYIVTQSYVSEQDIAKRIALSWLEKVFPLSGRIDILPLPLNRPNEIMVQYKDSYNKEAAKSLEDFFKDYIVMPQYYRLSIAGYLMGVSFRRFVYSLHMALEYRRKNSRSIPLSLYLSTFIDSPVVDIISSSWRGAYV